MNRPSSQQTAPFGYNDSGYLQAGFPSEFGENSRSFGRLQHKINFVYGDGRQWFSVQGVTEENRRSRIEAAIPAFVATVRDWQHKSGVGFQQTTLVGFSQGAIMSLEALKSETHLAGHIVAFSGRFAVLPEKPFSAVAVHLVHGDADGVIAVSHARDAARQFQTLGTPFTLDVVPGVGHGIDERMLNHALSHLPT
ncbi:esterase [Brenneria sp. 4F2]|nr:esterase [Brenneria bubanii]